MCLCECWAELLFCRTCSKNEKIPLCFFSTILFSNKDYSKNCAIVVLNEKDYKNKSVSQYFKHLNLGYG